MKNHKMKHDQMQIFLQGIPGSGKTTTAKEFGQVLGYNVLCLGTTNTAAAQFRSDTINTAFRLGKRCNFKYTDIPYMSKQAIIDAFRDIDLIVIDEASMMTPVTLARIDLHLRLCFDCDKPFGGFDVILIGDFFQFPPVQEGMSKPALYQAAVRFSRGLSLPRQNGS